MMHHVNFIRGGPAHWATQAINAIVGTGKRSNGQEQILHILYSTGIIIGVETQSIELQNV